MSTSSCLDWEGVGNRRLDHVLWRQPAVVTDVSSGESDQEGDMRGPIIFKQYDPQTNTAFIVYASGERMLAKSYRVGENGFAIATWAHL